MAFKAIIFSVATPPEGTDYEASDIGIEMDLPFVPVPGMMICPVEGDDYIEIDKVYYDPSQERPLNIYCCEHVDPLPDLEAKVQLGWVAH